MHSRERRIILIRGEARDIETRLTTTVTASSGPSDWSALLLADNDDLIRQVPGAMTTDITRTLSSR